MAIDMLLDGLTVTILGFIHISKITATRAMIIVAFMTLLILELLVGASAVLVFFMPEAVN